MPAQGSPSGCFARVVWFLFGPMALLVLAIMIAEKGSGWFGPSSIAFLLVLSITVLARWLDCRGGQPRAADGQPATAAQLRRYFIAAPVAGLAVWAVANLIGAG